MASEIPIWILISSPTVIARLGFPGPDPAPDPADPGLFLEPEPGDLRPNAFFILLAAVEVSDLCSAGESLGELACWVGESAEEGVKVKAFPVDVRQAATKIS